MWKITRIIAALLTVSIVVFVPLFAFPESVKGEEKPIKTEEYKFALTLWNIDVFEGGTGSRGDFLAARANERTDDGIIILVKSHTPESVKKSIEKGEIPDMVSFGVGVDSVRLLCRYLPSSDFKGGVIGGKTYAVPWCLGGYYLIVKQADNRLIEGLNLKNTNLNGVIVSQNSYNLPVLAMKTSGVTATAAEYLSPMDASLKFVTKEGGVLLGTQRDLRRLEKRGVAFSAYPLTGFSDLCQYIAVTTKSDEKYRACLDFIRYITSEKVQDKLWKIGMMRADGKTDDKTGGNADFYGYDFNKNKHTISPFSSVDTIEEAKKLLNTQKIDDFIDDKVKNTLKNLR